jgi:hypothetical protein
MTKAPNMQEAHQQDYAAGTLFDQRWEKEIERDLLLRLQSWYASSAVKAARAEYVTNPAELLAIQVRHFLIPVYFPLAGNTERDLGDALGATATNQLLLIECKRRIDRAAWDREANLPRTVPSSTKPNAKVIQNEGGKGRAKQLEAVSKSMGLGSPDTAQEIARNCHVLVAPTPRRALSALGGQTLCFTAYWDFVMGDGKDLPKIKRQPIDDLLKKGASFKDFRDYVIALVDARKAVGTDTRRLEDQVIVLASRSGVWHGFRTSHTVLLNALEAAHRCRPTKTFRKQ